MAGRILIVDDQAINRQLLSAILSPLNHSLTEAVDGQDALRRIEAAQPDLVLLDYMMPGLDGIETLRRIRARSDWAWFPVILVTAANDPDARLRGFHAGADEFLEKPVDRALLLARVATLLKLRNAQENLAERTRMLEELHRQRRELVDLIIHDLKNPLAVIHTNLKYVTAMPDRDSGDCGEALEDTITACNRMRALVIDILSVERMELNELSLHRQKINVATLVEEVVRAHQREAQIQQLKLSTALRAGVVDADPGLIRRAVENLVENAIHHTPPRGSIELLVEQGPEVSVVVSNTGAPIPLHIRETLFSKFVRGTEDGNGRFGLGLYFCQKVAAAHAGSLSLIDRAGWPVSFRFAMPAV